MTCWGVPTVAVIMGSLAAGAELYNVGLCRRPWTKQCCRLLGAQPPAIIDN
jgi:hypothetical protein